jgi:replication factor C large subunit
MTCNDVWQTKLSSLRAKCKLLEMKSLSLPYIVELLKRIAAKEGIKREQSFFNQIAIKSQGDIRAALNDLQSYHLVDSAVDLSEKRDVEDSIFNILKKLFKERQDFLNLFDTTKMSLDEIMLWIEENIPKEYKNEALVKAYVALGNADVFRGRIYKRQSWRFLVYQNIFQSAGISYAKSTTIQGFTKYEPPKRILKIWLSNQKLTYKRSIAKKFARLVHCSAKRAQQDFNVLKPIIKKYTVQKELRLTDEEADFLMNGS